MTSDVSVNPGYAQGQLARALAALEQHTDPAVRERTAARVQRWRQVIDGMARGSLDIGTRTPVADVPAWATLEVAHGGFATGGLLAGGPLQPHEEALLLRLGRPGGGRAALNLHFVSDPGLAELQAMLASGRYRVGVPEEGALLVVAWLMGQGDLEAATALLDRLLPFFERLRFYPIPDPQPQDGGVVVKLEPAARTRQRLEAVEVPPEIAAMREALAVWLPLTDRFVALFLETVSGDRPSLTRVGVGDIIDGGWPCAVYPDGWRERAAALLAEFAELRARHPRCKKPDDPKENLARLRGFAATILRDPRALTGRDVAAIRRILARHVHRHGPPGSARLAARRGAQAETVSRPTHARIARVLAGRLAGLTNDAGITDLDEAAAAVRPDESAAAQVPAGTPVPDALRSKLVRCLEAPVDELVARGAIRSSERLAGVLPQITAQVGAAAFADPALRRLYGAIYGAFRRRRSLLLLDYAHQVRIDELPWVDAVLPYRRAGLDARARARSVLEEVATLAITGFPQTILPNRLVQELGSLAEAAGLELPLVGELAADIFMGDFSDAFLRAAQLAARRLRGSLYERYYGLPYERVLRLEPFRPGRSAAVRDTLGALCRELAGVTGPYQSRPAVNGTIIEQEQILTTHNLAALFGELGLEARLRGRLRELAERCFRAACRWQRSQPREWRAAAQRAKNTAYAVRQMLFFLACLDDGDARSFLAWAERHAAEQSAEFRRRFDPALRGLAWVIDGHAFDADGLVPAGAEQGRRLLGWSTTRHWLRG